MAYEVTSQTNSSFVEPNALKGIFEQNLFVFSNSYFKFFQCSGKRI